MTAHQHTQLPLVLQREEWRPVVGYEGIYEVSDLGRVRRIIPSATNQRNFIGRPMHPGKNRNGYLYLPLTKDGKRRTLLLHLLVAAAFLGPCPQGYEVNHKDMNRANARLDNLEYLTPSQNLRHAFANGRVALRGEQHHAAKLTAADVRAIRSSSLTGVELARRYGVNVTGISKIRRRETWRHLGDDPPCP